MKSFIADIQIGKSGLTQGLVESITQAFKTRKTVKLKILKSSEFHNKETIKQLAEKIEKQLSKIKIAKIIGFTITLRKI